MEQIFQVGDNVFDFRIGWGEVIRFKEGNYPICVRFRDNTITFCYTADGKASINDKHPILSFAEYNFIKGGFSQDRLLVVNYPVFPTEKFYPDMPQYIKTTRDPLPVPLTETKAAESVSGFKIGEWYKEEDYNLIIIYRQPDSNMGVYFNTWSEWGMTGSKSWRPATRPEIIQALRAAFQAGERVEYNVEGMWLPIQKIKGIVDDEFEYRLAATVKQPEYRPFTWEDREEIMKIDWVKYKHSIDIIRILKITNSGVITGEGGYLSFGRAFELLETVDGKPFGKRVN